MLRVFKYASNDLVQLVSVEFWLFLPDTIRIKKAPCFWFEILFGFIAKMPFKRKIVFKIYHMEFILRVLYWENGLNFRSRFSVVKLSLNKNYNRMITIWIVSYNHCMQICLTIFASVWEWIYILTRCNLI